MFLREIVLFSLLLVGIDYLYLSNISMKYNNMIKSIQGSFINFKAGPAAVVYICLVASWFYFIYPTIGKKSLSESTLDAAALGFFIYAVYDFTNLATIEKWNLNLAVIDSFWGATLYAITTVAYIKIIELLG